MTTGVAIRNAVSPTGITARAETAETAHEIHPMEMITAFTGEECVATEFHGAITAMATRATRCAHRTGGIVMRTLSFCAQPCVRTNTNGVLLRFVR